VIFCVEHIEILPDYAMIFNVSWIAKFSSPDLVVYKHSDYKNANMYIVDNLGNKYDHYATGGSAAKYTRMYEGEKLEGSFTFPPAAPGAYIFSFVDKDNNVQTNGIELTIPVKIYDYFTLDKSPYRLRYPLKYWKVDTSGDGNEVLTHLDYANCTISEAPGTEPQGTLINTINVGSIAYEIYRSFDQDWSLREYVAVSGLEGIDPESPPILRVTIPYDNAEACIFEASDVLANLQTTAESSP